MDIKCNNCGIVKEIDSTDFFKISQILQEEGWDLKANICPTCVKAKSKVNIDNIVTIDGNKFKLISYIDTSAPCSKCYFLRDLICKFPIEKAEKQCEITLGGRKGWNTKEYELLKI